MASTEAQIKSEIERLTGICQLSISVHRSDFSSSRIATINQHKMYNRNTNLNQGKYSTDYTANQAARRSNVYVNPNYKPANKYTRPATASKTDIATNSSGVDRSSKSSTSYTVVSSAPAPPPGTVIPTSVGAQKKEIVLGGVAFESSGRSLVRKDRERSFICACLLIEPFFPSYLVPRVNKPVSVGTTIRHHPYGHKKPGHRAYKMKALRGRNMTLNNSRRPYPYVFSVLYLLLAHQVWGSRKSSKRINKHSDKPCPRFTTTGAPLPPPFFSRAPDRAGFPCLRSSALSRHNVYITIFLCFLL